MQDAEVVKDILNSYKEDADKAINYLIGEYASLKAGRANPRILDKIMVDYYGTMTPLNQMANISAPESRMLVVSLWDASAVDTVRKALQMANLGVSVSDDGKIIRLAFPILTEERRREIVKQVKSLEEDSKISIRNARRDCLDMFKTLKKDGELSEDEFSAQEKEVQKLTDSYNLEIEAKSKAKEKEVMEI